MKKVIIKNYCNKCNNIDIFKVNQDEFTGDHPVECYLCSNTITETTITYNNGIREVTYEI